MGVYSQQVDGNPAIDSFQLDSLYILINCLRRATTEFLWTVVKRCEADCVPREVKK